ncbi:MAG TPA: hypothetical protein VF665_23290 [Longimicrobium sp.]|jgi:hypothetical protein|uniref:hypothetical protein n=1 Tax=Longimicrobium sp. TaxID=2029185 RepID=UPI002EDBA181
MNTEREFRILDREQISRILEPANQEQFEAWDRVVSGMHTMLKLRSRYYPRPFVDEAFGREQIERGLSVMRGTELGAVAEQNVRRVHEVVAGADRGCRACWDAVDDIIDLMLDEDAAMQAYPGPPPVLTYTTPRQRFAPA